MDGCYVGMCFEDHAPLYYWLVIPVFYLSHVETAISNVIALRRDQGREGNLDHPLHAESHGL